MIDRCGDDPEARGEIEMAGCQCGPRARACPLGLGSPVLGAGQFCCSACVCASEFLS